MAELDPVKLEKAWKLLDKTVKDVLKEQPKLKEMTYAPHVIKFAILTGNGNLFPEPYKTLMLTRVSIDLLFSFATPEMIAAAQALIAQKEKNNDNA